MTKKQWTGEVTAAAAVEYAEYWTDHICSKAMAPVVQAAAPQEYVDTCVHKPGNHFATGADTHSARRRKRGAAPECNVKSTRTWISCFAPLLFI
jgi:hypothetical protein